MKPQYSTPILDSLKYEDVLMCIVCLNHEHRGLFLLMVPLSIVNGDKLYETFVTYGDPTHKITNSAIPPHSTYTLPEFITITYSNQYFM